MTDPQKITWDRFTEAYQRIRAAHHRCSGLRAESHTMATADGLEEAMMELHEAFQHRHVRSDDGDRCGLCGLDLRNEIHIRDN